MVISCSLILSFRTHALWYILSNWVFLRFADFSQNEPNSAYYYSILRWNSQRTSRLHSYLEPGTYIASLIVIDDDLYESNISKEIHIEGYEFTTALIFGRITNLSAIENIITFDAVNIRVITFSPLSWIPHTSDEKFIVSKNYFGFVGTRWILALCGLSLKEW